MKKITMIAVAILAICLISVPAIALDVDFSGSLRLQGLYHQHEDLRETSSSNAWFDQRFRLKTTFKVSDNLTVVTRMDALDGKKWGKNIDKDNNWDANVSLDAAYMIVKTPIGGFLAGRFPTTWDDNGFGDSQGNRERIYYVLPIGNFQAALVYEKWQEFDSVENPITGSDTGLTQSDTDDDKYLYSVSYKTSTLKYALGGGLYRVKTFVDLGGGDDSWYQLNTLGAYMANGGTLNPTYGIPDNPAILGAVVPGAVANAEANGKPVEANAWLFSPSIIGDIGPVHLDIEGVYGIGSGSYDYLNAKLTGYGLDPIDDVDVEVYCFNAEGKYTAGAFTFQAGYATFSGDDGYGDGDDSGKVTTYGIFESGSGWQKTFLLFGENEVNGVNHNLGGIGNLASDYMGSDGLHYSRALVNGYQAWYAGIDYAARENLTLGFIWLTSKADKVKDTETRTTYVPYYDATMNGGMGGMGIVPVTIPGEKWDDDHGSEYDFTLTWDIFENLEYKFIAAYLDAGDYWKQGIEDAEVEDTYSLYNSVTLSF